MYSHDMSTIALSNENLLWLANFKRKHGHPPRILHIGNIANNAYNNARLLNEAGLDCDVICYDYYHIMGCPEWEDAYFDGVIVDQLKPDWTKVDLGGFKRPRWFAQGPVLDCIEYLIARREKKNIEANNLWDKLAYFNLSNSIASSPARENIEKRLNKFQHKINRLKIYLYQLVTCRDVAFKICSCCYNGRLSTIANSEVVRLLCSMILIAIAVVLRVLIIPIRLVFKEKSYLFEDTMTSLLETYSHKFPMREDRLSTADMEMYRMLAPKWHRLFEHYDLIQAYATDPILPMLTGKRPYIGFEHGTLRSHTLRDDQTCRLTSLAYNMADHVFITNGDCLEYAQKIGVSRFTPMLHPIDERRISQIEGCYDDLRLEFGVRYVFLCTLRHDWVIKGTDQYIRALPELVRTLGHNFRVIMTRWGADLDKSISLAESLGVSDLIVWSEPLPRRKLIRTLKSVDVLFDQIALPHFGATAPEGIAAGIPVIMSYDPKSTEWLIAEPAPILTARNYSEIAKQVSCALDPAWLDSYRQRAATWFDTYHSSRLVVQKHVDTYRCLLRIDSYI